MSRAVAQATGLCVPDAVAAIEQFLDAILQTLAAGKQVKLERFGTFTVRTCRERVYDRAGLGGTRIVVPRRRVVRFTMGADLRAAVTDGKKVTLLGGKKCLKRAKR